MGNTIQSFAQPLQLYHSSLISTKKNPHHLLFSLAPIHQRQLLHHHLISISIILVTVHIRLREMSTLHPSDEQNIQLLKSPIFGLRQPEIRPDRGKQAQCPPEKRSLPLPIPRRGVHHIWLHNPTNDIPDIVCRSSKHNRLTAQARGADFRNDGVYNWASGHGIHTQPDQAESSLRVHY
jgi:hypothetical protein